MDFSGSLLTIVGCDAKATKTNTKLTPEKIFQYRRRRRLPDPAERKEKQIKTKLSFYFIFLFPLQPMTEAWSEGSRREKKGLKPNVFQILILNITNFSFTSCFEWGRD